MVCLLLWFVILIVIPFSVGVPHILDFRRSHFHMYLAQSLHWIWTDFRKMIPKPRIPAVNEKCKFLKVCLQATLVWNSNFLYRILSIYTLLGTARKAIPKLCLLFLLHFKSVIYLQLIILGCKVGDPNLLFSIWTTNCLRTFYWARDSSGVKCLPNLYQCIQDIVFNTQHWALPALSKKPPLIEKFILSITFFV